MIKPINDRIIIKRSDDIATMTAGGIHIPDASREKPYKGTVLAIGAKVEQIAVGDGVMFGKYSGTELDVDGEVVLIMREDEVLGVI